jgi:alkanesulfonate monooxygenase SsuD/methylene tetrahydromethanopterin reductase-like flavin-dependent oxidoreductase (luciferase family)
VKPLHPQVRIVKAGPKAKGQKYDVCLFTGQGWQRLYVCWSLTAAEERARWFSDALEHARRAASEDPEACVVLCRERDEARARLVEVECERKETMAKLAKVERNVAREPCEACAKKEATIEALNDWLTDTIIAHEPCEACAKKEES